MVTKNRLTRKTVALPAGEKENKWNFGLTQIDPALGPLFFKRYAAIADGEDGFQG